MPQPAKTPIAPAKRLRRVPGVLERLPGDLEELAVLRVHDRRFLRAEAEELAVEHLEPVERRGRPHVVPACAAGPGSRRPRAAPPRSARRIDSTPSRRLAQYASIELRARQMRGHADDRDVVLVTHSTTALRPRRSVQTRYDRDPKECVKPPPSRSSVRPGAAGPACCQSCRGCNIRPSVAGVTDGKDY